MQFFWKHLHNNKGDENVSKLIWIVIAFVIGALLLSTMSVAFRTEGEGSIGGWLNSTIDSWFGEADGRDGSTGGGTGSGGGLGGGGGSGGGAGDEAGGETGGSNDVPIVLKWNGTNLTSDLGDGNTTDYTDMFTGLDEGYKYAVSAYPSSSSTGTDADESVSVLGEEYAIAQTAVSPFKSGTMMLVANNGTTTGVDDDGNILITGLSSAPATTYAVYNQGTVGIENVGSDEEESFKTIPAGGTYYVGVTSTTVGDYTNGQKLEAGDEFPKTVSSGDVYVYNNYEYRYDYTGSKTGWTNSYSPTNGWGVKAIDTTLTNYGDILETINDKPVVNMNYTYSNCTSMENGTTIIPSTVTSMNYAYYNCSVLNKVPDMSKCTALTSMYGTFWNCKALTAAPDLSKCTALTDMYYAFANCTSLTGDIVIKAKEIASAQGIFYSTSKPITVYVVAGSTTHSKLVFYCESYSNVTILTDGDVYDDYKEFYNGYKITIGDYVYTYSTGIHGYNSDGSSDTRLLTNHWAIKVTDTTLTSYGAIRESLYGTPVMNADECFKGCSNMTVSPTLPDSIVSMSYCYNGCTSLVTPSEFPENAFRIYGAFTNCTSLKTSPRLPDGPLDLMDMFFGCTSLVTAPVIPSSAININNMFFGCTSLTGNISIQAKNITNASGILGNFSNNPSIDNPISIYVYSGSITQSTISTACSEKSNVTIKTF